MRIDSWTAAAAALTLATACSAGGGNSVPLLDYSATVPAGWQVRAPGNEMRIAEYTVRAAGADSAEVVVYYFGEGQGGSVEANVDRWSSQFSLPDGGPVTPAISKLEAAMFPTTLVELEGNYGRGMGMGPGRESATAGQALDAAVVETPKGNLYIQLFGDSASVRGARAEFLAFVQSIRG